MKFVDVKSDLLQLLGDNADGQFVVIGYKTQSQSESEVQDLRRTVQVYTRRGKAEDAWPLNGPYKYGMETVIEIIAAKAASGDLAVINNPSSTPAQIANAIINIENATAAARDSVEECYGLVFQIIMDSRHKSLGSDDDTDVDDRIIVDFKIHDPIKQGALIVIVLQAILQYDVDETAEGDTPLEAESPFIKIETEPWDISGETEDEITKTVVRV